MRRLTPLCLLVLACSGTPENAATPAPSMVHEPDATLARDLEVALEQSGLSSAAVVIDARSGEVLAQAEHAVEGSGHPLSDPRHPGSSMKPLLYAFALEQGVIDPGHRVTCDASFESGGEVMTCFAKHGELDLTRALATSCNEFAYDVASQLGVEQVAARYRGLGLCDRTARADLALAIGHGDLRVHPRQVGEAYRQGIVSGNAEARAPIIAGMIAAVETEEGSGSAARVEGLSVAGKTGTSEGEGGGYDGTFVALAPADDPEIILVVFASGDEPAPRTAAPIAGDILRRWQGRRSAG